MTLERIAEIRRQIYEGDEDGPLDGIWLCSEEMFELLDAAEREAVLSSSRYHLSDETLALLSDALELKGGEG